MPAGGERFRVFVELSFELEARDYYTAKQMADTIALGVTQVIQGARREELPDATARVLSVERKEK